MADYTTTTAPSCGVRIYVAGPAYVATEIVARFCFERGACFTVTPTEYVYTGGREAGVIVGLINYPRFPADPNALLEKATNLARQLIEGMHQHSATVEGPLGTTWISRRPAPTPPDTEPRR